MCERAAAWFDWRSTSICYLVYQGPMSTTKSDTEAPKAPPREVSWSSLPSAKGALKDGSVELGDPNPERLHVAGNLRHVVASKDEVIRLRNIKRAAAGAKRPRVVAGTTPTGTSQHAAANSQVKSKGAFTGKPQQPRRRTEL